jgi:omega-amidase
MRDLTVTLIQTELFWEDIPANLAMFDRKVDEVSEKTDLIILPEMFTTGFSMNAGKLAEPMNGSAVLWILSKAREKNAHILGSVIIGEGGGYYNRLLWAQPDGALMTYNKRHLFRMTGEHEVYTAGISHLTVTVNGWKVRPFICYDLRFPIWTRNIDNQYDVAIFIANWPDLRSAHWKLLMAARAVENQSYVIGVNRLGEDGNGLAYSGDSSIIDPIGNILFQHADAPCIHTASLKFNSMKKYREDFPAWQDADTDAFCFSE